ncbi:MAG TPA: NUDIX domain-containing protein [Phycisphaeraceae bacterium]|nr:NUDIX domain-containing protein [Phycisphaeraceae bacterium]
MHVNRIHPDKHTCLPVKSLQVICDGYFSVPADVRAEADAHWNAITAKNPHIFDGPILHVNSFDPGSEVIHCQKASYRLIAALEAGHDSGVRALGVSGIVRQGGNVLVARRGPHVLLYPGRWELAPSGVAEPDPQSDTVNLAALLLRELKEETGLSAATTDIHPLMFAYDAVTRSYDACFELRVDEPHKLTGNAEYRDLQWRKAEELAGEIDDFIPVSRMMLEYVLRGESESCC